MVTIKAEVHQALTVPPCSRGSHALSLVTLTIQLKEMLRSILKKRMLAGLVVQASNPRYSRSWGQSVASSGDAWATE